MSTVTFCTLYVTEAMNLLETTSFFALPMVIGTLVFHDAYKVNKFLIYLKYFDFVVCLVFESGPCAVRSPCRLGKECIVTPYNESKCVCSASLGHGCISTIAPMCSTEHLTFWSDCDMKNYSCLYPQKQFSILRQSRCNEGSRTKVTVNTTRGIETRHVYKCSLPKKVGPCKTANTRFYFDQDVNRCKSFVWGGCAPNSNNFESMEQCQKDCKG